MRSALEVAEYIIYLNNNNYEKQITNLKLQKLLYYCQGYHLALHKKPLFDEKVEAWEHGPVIADVYHKFKKYKKQAIPTRKKPNQLKLTSSEKDLINDVFRIFGRFSAWQLRNMTHDEDPWLTTQNNDIISYEKLYEYFKELIY